MALVVIPAGPRPEGTLRIFQSMHLLCAKAARPKRKPKADDDDADQDPMRTGWTPKLAKRKPRAPKPGAAKPATQKRMEAASR